MATVFAEIFVQKGLVTHKAKVCYRRMELQFRYFIPELLNSKTMKKR